MICLDASVAVKLVLDEEYSDHVEALLAAALDAGERVVGPPLLPIEVTNALLRRSRGQGGFTLAEAATRLATFLAFPIDIHSPAGLHQRALAIATEFGLSAAYDAHYLALAEQLDCPLWTDDRRLQRAMTSGSIHVRLIGDYGSATG